MRISKLKMYLTRNQIENKDLAYRMNITLSAIRTISEEGIKGIKTAKKYAKVLHCNYTDLLEEKDYENKQTKILD